MTTYLMSHCIIFLFTHSLLYKNTPTGSNDIIVNPQKMVWRAFTNSGWMCRKLPSIVRCSIQWDAMWRFQVYLWEERAGDPLDWEREPLQLGKLVQEGRLSSSEGDPILLLDESSMEGSCKTRQFQPKSILCSIYTYIYIYISTQNISYETRI